MYIYKVKLPNQTPPKKTHSNTKSKLYNQKLKLHFNISICVLLFFKIYFQRVFIASIVKILSLVIFFWNRINNKFVSISREREIYFEFYIRDLNQIHYLCRLILEGRPEQNEKDKHTKIIDILKLITNLFRRILSYRTKYIRVFIFAIWIII